MVPARVAGVDEVVLCVPPDRETGTVSPATLAAAALADVDEVYAVGGAQAIAAMAYGTESIAPVDVIAGPGNIWVAVAKREVAGSVGVAAAFAGPSEIVVVADDSTPPSFAAVDVIVQAEHGPDGLAWLITWSEAAADSIDAAVADLVAAAPRRAEIESTLRTGGWLALVDGPSQAVERRQSDRSRAPAVDVVDAHELAAGRAQRGRGVLRPVRAGVDRRLRRRAEPRPPDPRHGSLRRRAHRQRLRQGPAHDLARPGGVRQGRAVRRDPRRGRGVRGPRGVDPRPA